MRLGVFDVLVGINLLREGLDLPEVSLVAILDADKEGFLRSETSLIQTIGRAARNAQGKVIMYADTITGSMRRAIDETNRRRELQIEYNRRHGIVPTTIVKDVHDLIEATYAAEEGSRYDVKVPETQEQILPSYRRFGEGMQNAATALEFEKAAKLRDEIFRLKNELQS